MRLMISVLSVNEARDALLGGAEIVDVKNPAEGSLGAQSPEIIREITHLCSGKIEVSAAIGDMPYIPGTAALAALGAATCGADYIKIGMFGPRTELEARTLLYKIRQAVKGYPVSIIAAGYADFERTGTLNPDCLPHISASAGIQGILLDTYIKDGKSLFNFLDLQQLRIMAEQTHTYGMTFGLAGALSEKDLEPVHDIGTDIVGLRTAVCLNKERNSPLRRERIQRLLQIKNSLNPV
jgi:uncharacterized protein (UPF0264 family)